MTSTSSVSGLSSGIDWRSMIDQLRAAEHRSIDLVLQQKSASENKIKAWQELNTKLLSLKTAAEKLNRAQGFNLLTSALSSSSATDPNELLSATIGATGEVGSFGLEVLWTARAQKISSQGFSSQTAPLGAGYAGTLQINGRELTVTADDSLADVRNKINNLNNGEDATRVTASIVSYSTTDQRLILTSQNEGAAGIDLQPVGLPDLEAAFGFNEIQPGRDASLEVDGVPVTRSSNTITDLLPGITLNLKKAEEGTTVTLNISRDLDGVTGLITDFVEQYNQVVDFIRNQSSYNKDAGEAGGVLFGDGTLRSVKKDLVALVINPVGGVAPEFSILGMAGIKLDNQGKLSVNETTLRGHLESHFEDIKKLFIADGFSTTGNLKYITHGLKTQPGSYAVNVTQAYAPGVDIAGTINGEAAVGSGSTLTGAPGTSVEGLAVSYTGAATGEVGHVTLTLGVAETFSRLLSNLTDPYGGYVANKQTSLQSQIDGMEAKIERMESRLDSRMEIITRQYVAMEKSLGQMQSLSSWLSSQIVSLNNQ
ncbi:MAG: flagellar filament capping protein FliD [Deltaproteobacteria bacterium]|nr:flagellar filament capping protein FliD [Deltaproteobacteria bacterium]